MIRAIRGAIVVWLFVVFGLGALFIRYLILPFAKNKMKKYEILQKSWQFFIWIMKATRIIEVHSSNMERVKSIKNSIIVSTHPSFIDIVILMSLIPHSTCFVAQKLTRNPFFNGMVELLFIPDGEDTNKWLLDSQEKINEGLNIIIFPMGTRHDNHEQPKIRRGTAQIAHITKKNIAVLHIETSDRFLQSKQAIYDAGDKPIEFKIEYLGEINTSEYIEKYEDEVAFKTEMTKQIRKCLYKM